MSARKEQEYQRDKTAAAAAAARCLPRRVMDAFQRRMQCDDFILCVFRIYTYLGSVSTSHGNKLKSNEVFELLLLDGHGPNDMKIMLLI